VYGLSVEVSSSHEAYRISGLQNSTFNREAADARVVAGNAERDAGQANERAAKFDADRAMVEKEAEEIRSTNLVLQTKLLELEAKAADRHISVKQRMDFIDFLQRYEKGAVKMGSRNPNSETQVYYDEIYSMVTNAGFTVESQINYSGNLTEFPTNCCIGLIINTVSNAPPYTWVLLNAFNNAGLTAQYFVDVPGRIYSPDEGKGEPNKVLILVVEKH
jgi:hypothetical protein